LRLRSLKNKLALVFCGITLIAMGGVWFYVVPQLESNLRAQKRDDLKRVALATVDTLQRVERRNSYSPKHLDVLVRAISDTADAHLTLFTIPRSHIKPPHVPTPLSDSAANNVDQTTVLSDIAARINRTQIGYGSLNGGTVAQIAIPIGSKKRADWVAL